MSITLGSNIASLRGQRQLGQVSAGLGTTFERLSSGLRINSASDDSAGLALADSLKVNQLIYMRGVRNLVDGQSLLSVADSAVESLTSIVQRLEELAVQASTGTYTAQQRDALDAEAQALNAEFTRISSITEFNGIKLFTGELQDLHLQAGVGTNSVITAGIGGSLGAGSFSNGVLNNGSSIWLDVVTGDLDGDGNSDMAALDFLGSLEIFLGSGTGSFTSVGTYSGVGASISAADNLQLADFDGDGILDIAAANYGGDAVSVFLGSGGGSFHAGVSYAAGDALSSLVIEDFNGDDILDIAFGERNSATFRVGVLLGKGDGTFNTPTFSGPMGQFTNVQAADINSDGFMDLVGNDTLGNNSIFAIFGNGDGNFSNDYLHINSFTNAIELGDFNGDGRIDVAAAGDGNARIYLGNGDGTFSHLASFSGVSNAFDIESSD